MGDNAKLGRRQIGKSKNSQNRAFQRPSGSATAGWETASNRGPGFWLCPGSNCGMHPRRRGGGPRRWQNVKSN